MIRATLLTAVALAWASPALALNVKPAARAAKALVDDAARATARAGKAAGDDVARGVSRLVKARPTLAGVSDELVLVARHADARTARAVGELGTDAVRAAAKSPKATARWGRVAHMAEAEGLSPAAKQALGRHLKDGSRLEPLLRHAHKVGLAAALVAVGVGGGSALHSTGQAIEKNPELLAEPAKGVSRLFTLTGVGALLALAGVGVGFAWRRRRRPA